MSDPRKALEKADKTLNPKPKPQGYWISYRIDREPIEKSTCHCTDYSINISPNSRPEDNKNLRKAVDEFTKRRIPELEKHLKGIKGITALKAYTSLEKCQREVEGENRKLATSKSLTRD
jgi:hypothetical protein